MASVSGDTVLVDVGAGTIAVGRGDLSLAQGDKVAVSIRSELLQIASGPETGDDRHSLTGAYRETVYLGLTTSHRVSLADGAELTVRVVSGAGADATPAPGTDVRVRWKPGAARLHVN